MKTKLKIIIAVVTVLICSIFFFYLAGTYSSGSYAYAQQYKFYVGKNQFMNAVERFKSQNGRFEPPAKFSIRDSFDKYTYNFNVYLYYPDQHSIIYFVIDNSSQDNNTAYLYLVSINEGLNSPYYKLINKDFDRADNLRIKKEFEERILEKLGFPYKNMGNGMFIFWK